MSAKISRRRIALAFVEKLLAGDDRVHLVQSLAAFVVENKMEHQIELLIGDIAALLAERGDVYAEVATAFPLDADLRRELLQHIQTLTGAKNVELNEQTDPDLLGGFRLQLPGEQLDASVRTKLQRLQANQRSVSA